MNMLIAMSGWRHRRDRNRVIGLLSGIAMLLPLFLAGSPDAAAQPARGVVFHDANQNRKLDPGEKPLSNIRVSNGRDIATTGPDGRYQLPVDQDDILFVIKPRGWRTPLSQDRLPVFYYIHKPNGSPPSKYPGVGPTGPLPPSIDFPLYPQDEPERFQVIVFADPQPRDLKEIGYVSRDVVQELIGTQAAFGVTLGDIMFDDLSLFETQNGAIALLGIPWYNVIGNHDLNFDATNDRDSDETFERIFGPSYYSFDYGPVHFIVVDNVEWHIPEEAAGTNLQLSSRGTFRGGIGSEQMEFIRNDLAGIPAGQLVVLMMHIPLTDVRDRQALYRLIERRPFCLSISGHMHHHEHRFITGADGWRGPEPHHHIINVAVSGSWWSGAPDERGIPHTTMVDGAPNGYSILNFDGTRYSLDFKASGRSAAYQMDIHAPDAVLSSSAGETVIYANVFNGSARSKVEMRFGEAGVWTALRRSAEVDPHYRELVRRDNSVPNRTYRDLMRPRPSSHLWRGNLPANPVPGVHWIQIRTTDLAGRTYHAARAIRVLDSADPAR